MFCVQCGTELSLDTAACAHCGFEPQKPSQASSSQLGQQIQRQLATSSKDAASALRHLAVDPVGGLPAAYTSLGPQRARSAGIALCAFFSLAATIGTRIAVEHSLGGFLRFTDLGGVGAILKLFLILLLPPAAFAAASHLVSRVLGRPADYSADVFTAGAALAPAGLALLLGGLLGLGNFGVVALLFLFAFCYLTLMLYSGLTAIGGVAPKAAAPAVPVITVVAVWITKIAFTALF